MPEALVPATGRVEGQVVRATTSKVSLRLVPFAFVLYVVCYRWSTAEDVLPASCVAWPCRGRLFLVLIRDSGFRKSSKTCFGRAVAWSASSSRFRAGRHHCDDHRRRELGPHWRAIPGYRGSSVGRFRRLPGICRARFAGSCPRSVVPLHGRADGHVRAVLGASGAVSAGDCHRRWYCPSSRPRWLRRAVCAGRGKGPRRLVLGGLVGPLRPDAQSGGDRSGPHRLEPPTAGPIFPLEFREAGAPRAVRE